MRGDKDELREEVKGEERRVGEGVVSAVGEKPPFSCLCFFTAVEHLTVTRAKLNF